MIPMECRLVGEGLPGMLRKIKVLIFVNSLPILLYNTNRIFHVI